MLKGIEQVKSPKSGYERSERSHATREGREKRRKWAWVEIHIRATDWVAHQHHTDTRYNNVVLHIVLMCDNSQPTQRQDGTIIPTCSLNDVFPTTHGYRSAEWPCHHVLAQLHEAERTSLFILAGMLRLQMKAQVFFETLSIAQPSDMFNMYDVCLIRALAEGLGFGRDRAFFRAAGLRLIGSTKAMPEPLGRASKPSPVDAGRLQLLHTLVEQWRNLGAWKTFRQILLPASTGSANQMYQLRNIFHGFGTARTDILICNIVLPFAAAVAQQQRLHYIYAQACREKRCYECLIGKQEVGI